MRADKLPPQGPTQKREQQWQHLRCPEFSNGSASAPKAAERQPAGGQGRRAGAGFGQNRSCKECPVLIVPLRFVQSPQDCAEYSSTRFFPQVFSPPRSLKFLGSKPNSVHPNSDRNRLL